MKAKKKIKTYEELWSKTRDLITSITKNSDDYDEKYMKIKFNSADELTLNKTIEIPTMAIVVGALFHGNNKYYTNVYINYNWYKTADKVIIELTLLKELMLIKQVHQKSGMFVTIGIS